MKSIHEFLADEGVLKKGFLKSDYQTLILNEAMGLQVNNLTNNFNVSLLKNRIKMMTKTRSASWTLVKVMAAIPAFFAVLVFFTAGTVGNLAAQNTQQQTKTTEEQKVVPQEKSQAAGPVFTVVETMPSFPGGQEAMSKYLATNIKYPENAKAKGIQGTVFITYVVETDGSVSNVKVLRGIESECDAEAFRVVSSMPKWTPGIQKGQAVRVQFNLPIKFKLDEKSGEKK
jgi:TonB family protein